MSPHREPKPQEPTVIVDELASHEPTAGGMPCWLPRNHCLTCAKRYEGFVSMAAGGRTVTGISEEAIGLQVFIAAGMAGHFSRSGV